MYVYVWTESKTLKKRLALCKIRDQLMLKTSYFFFKNGLTYERLVVTGSTK